MSESDGQAGVQVEIAVEGDREQFAALSASLTSLIEVAAAQRRDWKLISALLHLIVEFTTERQGDVFAQPDPSAASHDTSSLDTSVSGTVHRRLSPAFRMRILCVIDSWSDDETADYLSIGLRQVRRRAQQGSLYYFWIDRKRRYPTWQFDGRRGILPGVKEVGRSIPGSWKPVDVYEFMTTRASQLAQATPTQWLIISGDPSRIVKILQASGSRGV